MKTSIVLTIAATSLLTLACKNGNSGNQEKPEIQSDNVRQTEEVQANSATKNVGNAEKVDVVFLANLYCKVTDTDKARAFLNNENNNAFTVNKDSKNNYACVTANTDNVDKLEFYMWTDKDGINYLGINLTETGERGQNKKSLQFFTYDGRLNMVVPCKRLNEVITNGIMSRRSQISSFTLKIPTSPENEDIVLSYRSRKDKTVTKELIFKWDGHTFNIE